ERELPVTLIGQFLAVYLVVQLMALAALPLAARFFAALPDRGYAFARLLGILLTGYVFWLGYSFGILRNEMGGAWLALVIVAVISAVAWWRRPVAQEPDIAGQDDVESSAAPRPAILPSWRYIVIVELLFVLAFAAWAWVRAHDPAADHTEQPMD